MARIDKIKRTAIPMYFNHCNRKQDEKIDRSNENIDNERTHLNYHFKEGNNKTLHERLDMLYYAETRSDRVVLASCVVTLPEDVKPEDEKNFFEGCYEFFCDEFGYENIVNAVVHKDETKPHIHISFIPVVSMDNKEISEKYANQIYKWGVERGYPPEGIISARDALNYRFFQTFHPRLYDYMTEKLGYETEILNGATANGNKTVLEMKNQKKQEELDRKQQELDNLEKSVQTILKQVDTLGVDKGYLDISSILSKMDILQKENDIFKNLLVKNNISIPRESAESLKESRSNYKMGNISTLTGSFKPSKKYIVIETFKNIERELPLQEYINSDIYLFNLVKNRKPKAVLEETDGQNNYLIVPTDNILDTIEAMYYIKNHEDVYDSLSMYQFSTDPDNLVREILKNTHIDTEYYLDVRSSEDKIREQIRE